MEYRAEMALQENQYVIVLTSDFRQGAHGDDGIAAHYNCEFKQHVRAAWEAHRFPCWLQPHFQHIADVRQTTCYAYDLMTR